MIFEKKMSSLSNTTGDIIVSEIKAVISKHEKYEDSDSWSVPKKESSRRSLEFESELKFMLNGVSYQIIQSLSCLFGKIEYNINILFNNSEKDIKSLKKLIKRNR